MSLKPLAKHSQKPFAMSFAKPFAKPYATHFAKHVRAAGAELRASACERRC